MTTPEPHCNHDPAAVQYGICECGAIVGPCAMCGDPGSHEVNGEALCSACASDCDTGADAGALDEIAAQLRAGTATLAALAGVVASTGRGITA